ncbi:MAG: metallophosphoesterase family protein [Chitinophagaceae bacterium]
MCLTLIAVSFSALSQEEDPVPSRNPGMPELLRGPYLQMASATGMTIRWRTNASDRSRVVYGSDSAKLSMVVDDSTLATDHIVRLNALKPYTRYYYSIGSYKDTIQSGANNYFYTLPEPGSTMPLRIAAFGDCGNNSVNQRKVRDAVMKYMGTNDLNAWILLGDNAYSYGTDAEFQAKFFNIYKNQFLKKYPLFPSPGNHDYGDIKSAGKKDQYKIAYYQNFTVPTHGEAGGVPSTAQAYYSFDIGNVHFLSLDSYGKDEMGKAMFDLDGAQVAWVKKDLEANKNKTWVVAYFHHPPYTMGSHDSDKELLLVNIRQNFIKILEDNGVDLVLNGHSHVYERSKLMKGYFGMENDFDSVKNNVSNSTGLYDGSKNSAPYTKSKTNTSGTVYVVSGSAGAQGGAKASYPHKAMFYSNNQVGGALMVEVTGNKLNVKWICADGEIRDNFTMMKDVNKKDEKLLKKDKQLL